MAFGERRDGRVGVEGTAAGHEQGALRRGEGGSGGGQGCGVRRRATRRPHARFEEVARAIEGFRLDVLAQGERRRAAGRGVGQRRQRPRQGVEYLFGAGDAIEIAADGAQAIIGGHGGVGERFDLLEDRVGAAAGEYVRRQEQQRQAVDMRRGGGGDHIGRARADGSWRRP